MFAKCVKHLFCFAYFLINFRPLPLHKNLNWNKKYSNEIQEQIMKKTKQEMNLLKCVSEIKFGLRKWFVYVISKLVTCLKHVLFYNMYINQQDAQNSCEYTLFSIRCCTSFGLY